MTQVLPWAGMERALGAEDGEADPYASLWDDSLFGCVKEGGRALFDTPPFPEDKGGKDGAPGDGCHVSEARRVAPGAEDGEADPYASLWDDSLFGCVKEGGRALLDTPRFPEDKGGKDGAPGDGCHVSEARRVAPGKYGDSGRRPE